MSLPAKVFLIGIGGTAMGNLACCLKRAGVSVGGSDQALYPPISDLLVENGITVSSPDDLETMEEWSGALFIVGNAVSRGHPQVEWLMIHREELRCSFPEFLGQFLLTRTRNLVVAGTHGKSTTTAVASHLLAAREEKAGWFVGGVLADQSPAFSWDPDTRVFAIEGDEYDCAFFDKRSKFVHYRPQVLLLNNLEFDHADIFRDTEDVQRTFRQVISLIPKDGIILFNGDDPRLREILPVPWAPCRSFGFGPENDFVLTRESVEGLTTVTIHNPEGESTAVATRLMGEFNARNVAGAALAVHSLLRERAPQLIDLSDFPGLKRRQEIRYRDENRILVEDFAHHPTAVAEALRALRENFPGWRIHTMLEPRSNTMRTNRLQDDLTKALGGSDVVSIAPIHRLESIPESLRLNTGEVINALAQSGVRCRFCAREEELQESFTEEFKGEKILTVVFSNGAFCGLLADFESQLRKS